MLLITALGMVETCNVVFLQARLQSATFEAARYATRPTTSAATEATSAQVQSYCNTLLSQLNVQGATVTISPASLSNLPPQTLVTITTTAPLSQNSATFFVITNSLTLTASATMIIE
jgi:Flp pilus assembly protein TadG